MAALGDPKPGNPRPKFRTQLDQLDRSWTEQKGYGHMADLIAMLKRKKKLR